MYLDMAAADGWSADLTGHSSLRWGVSPILYTSVNSP